MEGEPVEVDAGRRDEDALLPHAEAEHLLGDDVGAAGDDVRGPKDRLLAPSFELAPQPGRVTDHCARLPHVQGRDEQHGGHAELAGQIDPGRVEELVPLPDEFDRDVARRPRPGSVDGGSGAPAPTTAGP